ncbi:MAG TPA: cytochrome P450 [Mycobacterium sp.]
MAPTARWNGKSPRQPGNSPDLNSGDYDSPEEFRPERFMGAARTPAPYRCLPFGGGINRCLGGQMAMPAAQAQRSIWWPSRRRHRGSTP